MPADPFSRRFLQAQKRADLRRRAIEAKGGKCAICGYDACYAALDFHHTDAVTKDYDISARMSWKAISAELPKCVLLCARCHREVHDGLHPRYLDDQDSYRGMVD